MTRIFIATLVATWLLGNSIEAAPPNIVFFLVDDLGKHDLGCEGSKFYETPNLDRLAERSMRFVNGYSACQVCSSSRAAIQTGKYPTRTGITTWIHSGSSNQPEQWKRNTKLLPTPYRSELALEERTVAEELKQLGYATYFAGKWHLGGDGFTPLEQGYDINVGGYEYGTPPGGYFTPYKNPKLKDGPVGEQLPIRLANETAEFIRNKSSADQPYFAMLSFYSVHAPLETTQTLWKKYRDKAESFGLATSGPRFVWDRIQEVRQVQDHPVYAGMMESLDQAIGIVIEAVQASGEAQNTVIVFTSDNGGVSSGDGYATSCLPLRGGKGRQWEGGIRQPYYICWPGHTSGQRCDDFASGIDFHPTLVELAGGRASASVDGVSLVKALRGEKLPPRDLYWHYPHYSNQGGEPSAMIRSGDWKLIHYYEDDRNELYNLAQDPGEQSDLASQEKDTTELLWQKLQSWLKELKAPSPTANKDFDQEKYDADTIQRKNQGVANREREHAKVLQSSFQPNGGWWQFRNRK